MIVCATHFPAYIICILYLRAGLWNKNRCLFFHRHSLPHTLWLCPFGHTKNGATVSLYRHFLLSSLANSNFLWNFCRHFRWRLTQLLRKRRNQKQKQKKKKNRKCWQISCMCYTWFDKDVIPSVGVHASSGVCPQTHKTFLQNEIFYFLVIQSVVHHWSGFVLPGEF